MIAPNILAQLLVAALVAAGLPAPVVAAVSALALPIARLLLDLISDHQAGDPLPDLLVPEQVRDLDSVARLGRGVSPQADTLPPPPGRPTEPQVSLDGEEQAEGFGPSEAPTKVDS